MNSVPFTPRVRSARAHPIRKHPVLRHLTKLTVAIGAIGLLACEDSELERGIVIGKIDFDDPTWPLPQIPETATVGVPVEIAVWTNPAAPSVTPPEPAESDTAPRHAAGPQETPSSQTRRRTAAPPG